MSSVTWLNSKLQNSKHMVTPLILNHSYIWMIKIVIYFFNFPQSVMSGIFRPWQGWKMKMLSNLQTGLKPKLQDKVDWLISCGMYNFVEELFIHIEFYKCHLLLVKFNWFSANLKFNKIYKFQFITFLFRLNIFDHDEALLVQGIS